MAFTCNLCLEEVVVAARRETNSSSSNDEDDVIIVENQHQDTLPLMVQCSVATSGSSSSTQESRPSCSLKLCEACAETAFLKDPRARCMFRNQGCKGVMSPMPPRIRWCPTKQKHYLLPKKTKTTASAAQGSRRGIQKRRRPLVATSKELYIYIN